VVDTCDRGDLGAIQEQSGDDSETDPDIADEVDDNQEEDDNGSTRSYVDGESIEESDEQSLGDSRSVDTNEDLEASDSSEEGHDDIDKELERCVLRILKSKVEYGWSQQETLSQLQSLYELTNNECIPHKTWPHVMKFLKKMGYKNPRHYKVCCGADHVTLIDSDSCPFCNKPKAKCADYFVLGINLRSIFLSKNNIIDHLAHWKDKEHWMNRDQTGVPYKEIWDGERYRELSYFWDASKETFLPTCCPNCDNIISLDEIKSSSTGNTLCANQRIPLYCPECLFDFVHTLKTMKGSPINQAFIFHEDGFNAFSKKTRGVAAIHISNACTKKEDRLHQKNIHVYSFIPSFLLQEGIPHKMDAFLRPLIDEITELYLNGIEIYIPQEVELPNLVISEGWRRVRALLLLGTADMKGHAEITLYAAGKLKMSVYVGITKVFN
jgi:hypothetical protein